MIKTAALVIALAVAGLASADPIFPPLVSGEYRFRILAADVELDADGVPLQPPTVSVGVKRVDEAGPLLACEPSGPGQVVPVTVVVSASGDRGELRGYAYTGTGCTGDSAESVNAAYVFFVPPAPPSLDLGP